MRLGGKLAQRFTVQRCLGSGGMGIVYEAYDADRRGVVALKTLRNAHGSALLRFKNEFRALADLSHPNLVALDELFAEDEQWFFTMELIRGTSFWEYVRPTSTGDGMDTSLVQSASLSDATPDPDDATMPTQRGPAVGTVTSQRFTADLRMDRLEAAARQLAQGIHALHQSGHLHCDLKPSNVLVEHTGRVAVCDFGLVSELSLDDIQQSHDGKLAGTVAFMSPEQAAMRPLDEASDWYSLGVILFYALAGHLPFAGAAAAVLSLKQQQDAPDLRKHAGSASPALVELAMALLARDPAARPGAEQILTTLGAGHDSPPQGLPARRRVFVGREAQVAALWRTLGEVRDGNCRSVFLRGRSGMGKTAIAQRFVASVVEGGQALTLSARCYERESVPYKAVDAVIDALTEHLARLPAEEVATLLPADVGALVRLFPVMARVKSLTEHAGDAGMDPQQARRTGFKALRTLLGRLAARTPLLVLIDDLQWSDADSVALLGEVFRPRGPDNVMLLGTYRQEDVGSPRLATLREELGGELTELEVGPLSEGEADALARSLLGRGSQAGRIAAVARESGGSPLFVAELAEYARGHDVEASVTLETALRRRIEALVPAARELLCVVAVAGRPVSRAVAGNAAGLGQEESRALAALRGEHLVRTTRHGEGQVLESYHDRIRETVIADLGEDRLAAVHRRLADALDAAGQGASEAAVEHWKGAGEVALAASLAVRVAREAASALAFDQAARLFRVALEHGSHEGVERARLLFELGDALAYTGRAPEAAADAYLEAANGFEPRQALEARRRAAYELLRSGHITRGLDVLKEVLAEVGLELPRTPGHAVRALLRQRFLLRLRGEILKPRDPASIPEETLRLMDTTWSVSRGLGIVDNVRAAAFQSLNLRQALAAGAESRACRAMCMEACYLATGAGKKAQRARELLMRARELAERLNTADVMGYYYGASCVVSYLDGRWRLARDFGDVAARLLNERGAEWERTTSELFATMGRLYMGELQRVFSEYPDRLREAVDKQDLYAATNLRSRVGYLVGLAQDDPGAALDGVRLAKQEWSYPGLNLQHYFQLSAETQIHIYRGEPQRAFAMVEEQWPAFRKGFLLRIATLQTVLRDIRGRAVLALAGAPPRLLARAERDARWLHRAQVGGARPVGALLFAGLAARRGDTGGALRWLSLAESGFDGADMALHLHVTRWRRGDIIGGDAGAELRRGAGAWMRGQGIQAPDRFVGMLAPGFGGRGQAGAAGQ